MTATTSLTVTLSQEEVVYLLALIQARFIPGLGPTPLGEATDDEARAALATAERGLIARNVIASGLDGRRQVNNLVIGLVGTCAYPSKSFLLNRDATDDARGTYYFHVAEEGVIIEHIVPENGIHQFTAYHTVADGLDRLAELLELRAQPTLPGTPGTLDESTPASVRALVADGDSAQAHRLLTSQGLDDPTATALVSTFSHLSVYAEVISMDHAPDQPQITEHIILVAEVGAWLLTLLGSRPVARWAIRPLDAATLHQWIQDRLTPTRQPAGQEA